MDTTDNRPTRIFLTGFMGAGKSTIGKRLAQKIGYKFYDTDHMLVRGFGKPISQIFAENGEDAFREAEDLVIQELCKRERTVISTGGGTLIREETMGPALANGTVIYLTAPAEVLYERVIFSPKDRPILNEPETESIFMERYKEREAIYSRAHHKFQSYGRGRDEVVDEIISTLDLHPQKSKK